MKITRKHFIQTVASTFTGGMVAALGTGAYMRYLEPHHLEVTHKKVKLAALKKSLRLLHLSDFHASPEVPYTYIEKAIDLSLAQQPDIACITGDFISWKLANTETYRRILEKLSRAVPTYASIGNHDGGRWAGSSHGYKDFSKVQALLQASGIRFLFNTSEHCNINGQPVTIAGLGDLWSEDLKPQEALQKKRVKATPTILLSHNPDSKERVKEFDWDLMLCGHTHGGQLVIPFLGNRPFLPIKDKRFAEGLFNWEGKQIHVTRGIGNLHGMRFNCRPEISILEMEA